MKNEKQQSVNPRVVLGTNTHPQAEQLRTTYTTDRILQYHSVEQIRSFTPLSSLIRSVARSRTAVAFCTLVGIISLVAGRLHRRRLNRLSDCTHGSSWCGGIQGRSLLPYSDALDDLSQRHNALESLHTFGKTNFFGAHMCAIERFSRIWARKRWVRKSRVSF